MNNINQDNVNQNNINQENIFTNECIIYNNLSLINNDVSLLNNDVSLFNNDVSLLNNNIQYYDIQYYNRVEYNTCEFVHFSTEKECNDFIIYINSLERNIKLGNRCCENKGCSILNIDHKNIIILKQEFIDTILVFDHCDICYEIKILKHKCSTYKHPFCIDCLSKTNICPLCRQPYIN